MKKLIVLCFVLGSLPLMAEVVRSPIHSVEKIESNYLIKFENGRVGFLSAHDKSFGAHNLQNLAGSMVEARLNEDYSVVSMKVLEEQPKESKALKILDNEEAPLYEPTIVPSLNEATKIFKRFNPNYRRASECSNRAHVWASEEFKKTNLKSMKVYALFTASYITRVRFKWWYHVAPMLAVKEGGKVERRVMDFMFTHQPVKVKEWTDQFVFSKRPCLPTTKFSEYDVNPQTEDCYLMDGPMYNWTPTDLSNEELQGRYKTEFSQGEIRAAYSEAF
jgi:hypothetical protein